MLDWSQCPLVERSADKVSGVWLLKTRVPVKALFENLEDGATTDQFAQVGFSGVSKEQVFGVLEFTENSLTA